MATTMAKSKYLEAAILGHLLRSDALASPATVYLGIVSSDATAEDLEAGDLTHEVSGYDGGRPAVSWNEPTPDTDGTYCTNDGHVDFESMPGVTLGWLVICDADAGGNVLYYAHIEDANGAPATPTILAGGLFRVPDEAFRVKER